MKSTAKILVTGGAGFIGAHVAQALLARGDDVVILDDFNSRYDPRLKEERVTHLFAQGAKPMIIRADICDRERVAKLFSEHRFDQVVHLAAWASVQPSIQNPYIYAKVNVDGTVVILEECRKHDINNLVFASTSSVYGGLDKTPFRETDNILHPISPYAATKVAGEALCSTWNYLYKLPITALRFFTVYGPWGRPEMAIFQFAKAIRNNQVIKMRGKDTQRDFTYIDDIVQGVLGALDHPDGFSVFNLGESDAVPLPRFVSALEQAMGQTARIEEVPLPPGDIPRTLADISSARRELGYNPTTRIEDGVKKFVEWYQSWYVPNFET